MLGGPLTGHIVIQIHHFLCPPGPAVDADVPGAVPGGGARQRQPPRRPGTLSHTSAPWVGEGFVDCARHAVRSPLACSPGPAIPRSRSGGLRVTAPRGPPPPAPEPHLGPRRVQDAGAPCPSPPGGGAHPWSRTSGVHSRLAFFGVFLMVFLA